MMKTQSHLDHTLQTILDLELRLERQIGLMVHEPKSIEYETQNRMDALSNAAKKEIQKLKSEIQ